MLLFFVFFCHDLEISITREKIKITVPLDTSQGVHAETRPGTRQSGLILWTLARGCMQILAQEPDTLDTNQGVHAETRPGTGYSGH